MASPAGYVMHESGFWYKLSDQSGPYVYDGASMALAGSNRLAAAPAIASLGTTANVIYNPKADYSRWRAKLAAVRNGTGNARVVIVGSSEQGGYRALTTANSNNCRPYSQAQLAAAAMNSTSTPTINAGRCGDFNLGAAYPLYDPGLALGGTAQISLEKTIGGNCYRTLALNDTISLLPYEQVDRFRVWCLRDTALGSMTLSRTGDTSSGPLSCAGAAGFISFEFSGALGNTAPLVITQAGAGQLFIAAIEAWNSTQSSVQVLSAAWQGGTSLDRSNTSKPSSYLSAMASMAFDMVILCEDGINDGRNGGAGITPAQHYANVEKQIQALLPVSDIILETGFAYSVADTSLAIQKQYRDNLVALGQVYNLHVHDPFVKDQSWELQNYLGQQIDAIHKNAVGYGPYGRAKAGLLLSV